MTADECRYPSKRAFPTRARARLGTQDIRETVEARGGHYNTLYPYRCPGGDHWHLSGSRQGAKDCRACGTRQPAWFDSRRREWVVYAHGECATQAVAV